MQQGRVKMAKPSERVITVVGAGFMGIVIASIYALHEYRVRLTDLVPEALKTFRTRATPIVASLADGQVAADAIFERVALEPDFRKAVDGSFFIHEVITENLEAKQAL